MDDMLKFKIMTWFVESVTMNQECFLESDLVKMKIRMSDSFKPIFGRRLYGISDVLNKLNLISIDLESIETDNDSFTVYNDDRTRSIKIKLGEDDEDVFTYDKKTEDSENRIKVAIDEIKSKNRFIEIKLKSDFIKELHSSIKAFKVKYAIFTIENSKLIISVKSPSGDRIVLLEEKIEGVEGIYYSEKITPMFHMDWDVRLYPKYEDQEEEETSLWVNEEEGFEVLNPLYIDDLNYI